MTDCLVIDGLCKRYGEIVVADQVSLSLARGQCLGVVGPNGAGKSSLFNLITGVAVPDAGSIRLEGRELVGLRADARARLGVARAFQIPQPFAHLSAYENALAAATFAARLPRAQAERQAWAVLERTGLADRADVPAGRLPLLDRKRLELAKGLAARPHLLLLDEIAGGLTEAEVQVLVALVLELKQDVAMIWIEHIAQALMAVADRIMVLNFGRKLLEDAPAAAMASREVREVYMGVGDEDALQEDAHAAA
ncbi:ABC transporter ATP-binding protein [Acidovorax cavernicola]|uniref:ATP-binding cassette domain-containing protein n=1 Tax=Acidovorax cavernicola TaxID=1675792 RepID=A0A9X8D548_9BURK|nr:ATP-binding cassette domain-containing protein [Acidovorax cavernicola]RIX79894.1 ATP-binding cassette domain-containing protein [Acidovorax cavernicola]